MNKAVFFDRDGVILRMVYDQEHGTIDTITNTKQLSFVYGSIALLKHTTQSGYKNIIVSNQPAIGLRKMSPENFQEITDHMITAITGQGATIDAQYYCFHHPFAAIETYRKRCDCRKPNPGLLLQAAKEHNLDLTASWMIGDGVNDILAGHAAGCRTILLGNVMEAEYLSILEEQLHGVKPDAIIKKLPEAISLITT